MPARRAARTAASIASSGDMPPNRRSIRPAERSAESPSAAHAQRLTFEAPRDLLDPAYRDGALAELASLGVHSLRVVLYWHNVAPAADSRVRPNFDATDPAAYNWGQYDALIDAAAQRGSS